MRFCLLGGESGLCACVAAPAWLAALVAIAATKKSEAVLPALSIPLALPSLSCPLSYSLYS